MPPALEPLSELTLGQMIVATGVALAALTGLWGGWVRLRAFRRRFWIPLKEQATLAFVVLNGRPAVTLPEDPDAKVSPAIPGVAERLSLLEAEQRAMRSDVAEIKHEVTYNDGGSLKDCARRTERSVEDLHLRMAEEERRSEVSEERFKRLGFGTEEEDEQG